MRGEKTTVKRENKAKAPKTVAQGARAAAMGLTVVGMGLLAVALWSAAGRAEAATATSGRGTVFSAYIDDLPIMPGLNENDEGYAFDLFQGGRLAEARLGGEAEATVVRGFYAATLTQLGWRASETEPYVYHRGRERLIFLVEPRRPRKGQKAVKGLEAVFVITPDSRGPAPVSAR